jgi:hypothetical protein
MSTDNLITLITAGLAFLASVIAIIVSVYNARFARFASEKWWERKAEAYTRIIDALSDLVYYFQETYEADTIGTKLSEERRQEVREHWRRGNLTIRKATNIGAFLISPEAENALKQYWRQPDEKHDPGDWIWQLEHDYASAETCLKQLVICAKRDLGLETARRDRHNSRQAQRK